MTQSLSKVEIVKKYIFNQKKYHEKIPFKEEYRTFLKEYKIDFDEHYVWD